MNQKSAQTVLALAGAALAVGSYAQSANVAADPAASATDDEVIVLSPFEVTASESNGYVATTTLAGSRINTQLKDVGSAISVVTAEFMKDTGATDSKSLLQYTTNTEVASIQGNFTNASTGNQQEEGTFTTPNSNTRVRGLTSADNTRNFFITDIPWDSYNVDRVDMQRGANSILFGMGSPAGIINTSTKTAQYRNFGELEFRYGSYDTNRVSLDYNYCLLDDELAFRVSLLRNDQKYKQKPAYSLDNRVFATARYEPKFLSRNGNKTTVKVNYESGSIRSNNPRVITPIDMITPWFTDMDQTGYDPNTVRDNQPRYTYDSSNRVTGYSYLTVAGNQQTYAAHVPIGSLYSASASASGGTNTYYNPWLTNVASSYESGPLTYINADGTAYMIASGMGNIIGARNSDGSTKNTLDAFSDAARVAIAPTAAYASNAGLAYKELYKSATLSDSSVFDFYNNLLDGDTKREWQNFHNFSAALSQTFLNQKCGFELAYDESVHRRGQYSLLTDQRAGISIDINTMNMDGTANTNYGKAYIADSGIYGNNDIETNREASRASVFFDHNFNEDGKAGWFYKLLGRHTLSGLYSQDMVQTDTRNFMRWGTGLDLAALTTYTPSTQDIKGNRRTVHPVVYLTDSLSGLSLGDVTVSRAGGSIDLPSTIAYTYFDGTWNAGSSVGYDDPWVNTRTGAISTQSQNPDNYVGWKTTNVTLINAEDGFDSQDALTYSATLLRKKSDSRAAVLQSYLWDGAIVGMYGIRRDTVKSWSAGGSAATDGHIDFDAVNSDGNQIYSTGWRTASITKKNSPSWSVVAHLNKLFGKLGDRCPINVSLYYNESENFQVVGTRYDIYGNEIPAASGTTKDRGIMLSTKDDRFSLRINKYESTVLNASSTSGLNTWLIGNNADATIFAWGETWADVYDYRLGTTGDASSAGTNSGNWTYTGEGSMTVDQADALRLSSIAAWRSLTSNAKIQQVLTAFGYNDFTGVSSANKCAGLPNFAITEDQVSKGYEFELTANPTKNWRISLNASKTQAMRTNVGGAAFNEVIEILNNAFNNTDAGQIRLWGGGNLNNKVVSMWNSSFYNSYVLMKLQEGTFSPELRKWHVNVVTNYDFTHGRLKGFNIGAGYRWMDKVAIGYPVASTSTSGVYSYDIANPIFGPREDAIDFWVGYEKQLTPRINWRIQFNVRNLGDGNKLIPLTIQPTTDPSTYTVAAWRIAPGQTWEFTNTFKF